MDPASIIGLVAATGELACTAKQVVDLIKSFKDGDKDLAALAHELVVFTEALSSFDRVLRSKHTLHHISVPVLDDLLRHAHEHVQELDTQVRSIGSSTSSTMRRAKWVRSKSSLNKAREKLKEKNTMLHTFLTITHTETVMAMSSQFPSFMISQAVEPIHDTPVRGAGDVSPSHEPDLLRPTSGFRPRTYSAGSVGNESLASDATSLAQLSIFDSARSIESVTSRASSTFSRKTSSDSVVLEEEDDGEEISLTETQITHQRERRQLPQHMFVMRRSCHYNCHCQCHDEPVAKPGRRFMGSRSSKKNDTVQCTDASCLGNETVSTASEQHSRSFRKALSGIMSAKTLEVRYELKHFRTVPEGSDQVRFVKHGNLDKLKLSIESGAATIWDTSPDGWSLLHVAAYSGQVDIVKYLLQLGVATETGDIGTRTAADFAVLKSLGKTATESQRQLLKVFSDKDDVIEDFDFTPIHKAVLGLYGHSDRERPPLEDLIDLTDEANNAPVNTDWGLWKQQYRGRSSLFGDILEYFRSSAYEATKGTKIIHNLIDQKDKKYHWTPLHWAACSGRVREMEILIKHGADPLQISNLGGNIIHSAVESRTDEGLIAALKIWKQCSDRLDINQVNIWGETAVHIASCLSASCVRLLLEAGADPNVQEENGMVALHFAALSAQSAERSKIASVLCNTEDASHINTRDWDGRPPVFDFLDDPKCVQILLQHGAKIELTDELGQNVVHHACIQGEDASLQVMLEQSDSAGPASVRDNNGNTPLIEAFSNSNTDCAMTLLRQLKDLGPLIGKDGWSPIHYAAKIGEPELLETVCQHPSFIMGAKTLDGKRANVVAMEAGTWQGAVKQLIRKYDYMDW